MLEEISSKNVKKYKDAWGFSYDITNLEDGWNKEKMKLCQKNEYLMQEQIARIPTFTTTGFVKLKIPKELFTVLKNDFRHLKLVDEDCQIPNCNNNCYRMMNVHEFPLKSKTKQISGMFVRNVFAKCRYLHLFSLIS